MPPSLRDWLAAGAGPPGVVLRPLLPRVDRELALAVPSLDEAPPAVHALLEVAEQLRVAG